MIWKRWEEVGCDGETTEGDLVVAYVEDLGEFMIGDVYQRWDSDILLRRDDGEMFKPDYFFRMPQYNSARRAVNFRNKENTTITNEDAIKPLIKDLR